MKKGFLSEYFKGVAVKKLSNVEVNPLSSNQHEFNASQSLKEILGNTAEEVYFNTKFLYLSDNEHEKKEDIGFLCWYDARAKNPKRSEYRLYFKSNKALASAKPNDSLFICLTAKIEILAIVACNNSIIESQLYYLFNIDKAQEKWVSNNLNKDIQVKGNTVARDILEKIGIEYKENNSDILLSKLIENFGNTFPSTKDFFNFAVSNTEDIDPVLDPDDALIRLYDQETILFKIFEKHIISQRLKEGFIVDNDVDVEGFIKFSLSIQNRRKARAGYALENSIEYILNANHLMFSRNSITEHRNRPDFLFPNVDLYHLESIPDGLLTMLGAKTTCKDRWRQVLEEANRIEHKHLITLEGAISIQQTEQMQSRNLQLVVPTSIQLTYTEQQQNWIISFKDFIDIVKKRQKEAKMLGFIV